MRYDPKEAVKHVVHDYVYLVVAGTDTQRPLDHPFNHYAERTFHTHCRAFGDFFSDKNDSRDLYARHFTRGQFIRTFTIWDEWRGHIDKHLMHLTTGRITNRVPWTGEPNQHILKEFRAAWDDFLADLQDDLKPLFAQELEQHRKSYPKYPI
ncbi:hypothetical protein SBA4_6980005 [Candidatus Sulfopaludibacter sp. SbA4]|nr:hypothetical protein SBA4_6980005 [Candidatus Sulfopaludibacter sp. SbA4]